MVGTFAVDTVVDIPAAVDIAEDMPAAVVDIPAAVDIAEDTPAAVARRVSVVVVDLETVPAGQKQL